MSKVLVIDDEINLLETTVEGLLFEGFEVISASSGAEALQLIRDDLPDIVICDINMPEMDGYEILANLRDDLLTSAIPFIFLSARSKPTEIREGMIKGADDYLVKPVNTTELVQTIRSRLNRQTNLQMNRLREFAQRLVIAQESERHNFATTLKDNLVDKLSDLKISLNTLIKVADKYSLPLQAATNLLDETLSTVNKLSYALWPSVLTQLGLEAAVFSLLDHLQEKSAFQVEFEYYELNHLNDPNLTIMLYRIIQEALVNIKQHAGVNAAHLKLWFEDDYIRLQIEDKGIGFDVQAALNLPYKLGLLSMMERAFLLNGELNIISSQAEGTRIYGKFPLGENEIQSFRPQISINSRIKQASIAPKEVGTNSVRIAIADSNELSRWGYSAIIETDSRFTVVSGLSNWSTLWKFLEDIDIDMLIISHVLDGAENGLTNLSKLSETYPNLKILLLSNYTEYIFASEALQHGAAGYLLKTSGSEEVLTALHILSSGKHYIDKALLNSNEHSSSQTAKNTTIDAFSTLTEREQEIFYHVVNGQTNQEIANDLVISIRTVEAHRLNMMRKLGLTRTASLINFAIKKGLIDKQA